MIKKLIYLIIPFIIFSFSQNVKALGTKDFKYTKINLSTNPNTERLDYYLNSPNIQYITESSNAYLFYEKLDKEFIVYSKNEDYKTIIPLNTSSYNIKYFTLLKTGGNLQLVLGLGDKPPFNKIFYSSSRVGNLYTQSINSPYFIAELTTDMNSIIYIDQSNKTIFNRGINSSGNAPFEDYLPHIYSNFSLYDSSNKLLDVNYIELEDGFPELSYTLKPIYKDGYISKYGIKVNSSIVDDTLYKYQYAIKEDINDELNWVDLYNNNFLNNEFAYITKKPIYFYFRILDKSNNDVIDAFTVTITFNLVSPEYDIIFNQTKFYLSGTNIINRLALSITYKTSVDGLKYQYQYVNDSSSLDENNWVDTESDIYRVYDVNGVMYARILDNENNVLYSATFKNTLIGQQDILENPTNFPLYNKVQSVLNFNKGSISDIVLIPVKVLMFMSDSLNNNSCSEYSFGSLLGHELKMPCIDIKSYVGNTIYNFYDLVCSFFISLGIVKLLKNIYMRFMTLEIRDIDSKGGIF